MGIRALVGAHRSLPEILPQFGPYLGNIAKLRKTSPIFLTAYQLREWDAHFV
jgi:hypothetical protein